MSFTINTGKNAKNSGKGFYLKRVSKGFKGETFPIFDKIWSGF
jgi:hypothetical protein